MIIPGTILMAQNALRPQWMRLDDESHPSGWRTVRHDLNPRDLERELASGGWAFFYMAGPVRTTKFGFDRANDECSTEPADQGRQTPKVQ